MTCLCINEVGGSKGKGDCDKCKARRRSYGKIIKEREDVGVVVARNLVAGMDSWQG